MECYFYLDSTPRIRCEEGALQKKCTASQKFPCRTLAEENCRRGKNDPEFELADTGVFDGNRYFDVFRGNTQKELAERPSHSHPPYWPTAGRS